MIFFLLNIKRKRTTKTTKKKKKQKKKNANGGFDAMGERTTANSSALYDRADKRAATTPYVNDTAMRSLVVGSFVFVDFFVASA
ncbi:hypothetical protein BT091_11740 [Corynebacterium diphtheriae]|nr:hypothetical protein BT091_11740 [Corynebacterium diphtheriae]